MGSEMARNCWCGEPKESPLHCEGHIKEHEKHVGVHFGGDGVRCPRGPHHWPCMCDPVKCHVCHDYAPPEYDEDNVVSLEEHQAHESGTARCASCGREWVAVAPVRRRMDAGLECPTCGMLDGYYLISTDEAQQVLSNIAAIFDGWHADGTAWSDWDESVRAEIPRLQVTLAAIEEKGESSHE